MSESKKLLEKEIERLVDIIREVELAEDIHHIPWLKIIATLRKYNVQT